MNQEERRQKRQDEFKHAAVVVTVFVLVLAVMIIGAAAALHKFLPKGTKEVRHRTHRARKFQMIHRHHRMEVTWQNLPWTR